VEGDVVTDPDRIESERLGRRPERLEEFRAVGDLDAEPDAAPGHSMSSSARARTDCGILRPTA
jgi:hypothetical protein